MRLFGGNITHMFKQAIPFLQKLMTEPKIWIIPLFHLAFQL